MKGQGHGHVFFSHINPHDLTYQKMMQNDPTCGLRLSIYHDLAKLLNITARTVGFMVYQTLVHVFFNQQT
jgi:hypothetical protein